MLSKRSTLLFIFISATLFSASFAGEHRKLLHRSASISQGSNGCKDHESSRKFGGDEQQQILLPRSRILVVKTNDYGNYEPTPALSKPPFKLIPN